MQAQGLVLAEELQRLAVLRPAAGGGQTLQRGLAAVDLVGDVGQVRRPVSLIRLHCETRLSEVPRPPAGVLHGEIVQVVQLTPHLPERLVREGACQILHVVVRDAPAVVGVGQKARLVDERDEIRGAGGLQPEHPLLCVE